MTSISGLLVWLGILITYCRFYRGAKLQEIDRRALPYFAPCQPYLTYYGIFMIVVILFFSKFTVFIDGQWDTADFVTTYLVRPLPRVSEAVTHRLTLTDCPARSPSSSSRSATSASTSTSAGSAVSHRASASLPLGPLLRFLRSLADAAPLVPPCRWALRPLAELDFVSGSRAVEDELEEESDGKPKSRWARAMDAVF